MRGLKAAARQLPLAAAPRLEEMLQDPLRDSHVVLAVPEMGEELRCY